MTRPRRRRDACTREETDTRGAESGFVIRDVIRGRNGQITIVAMHTIRAGEEVTIDYAMCDGTAYDEFECACGTATCRGRVTGADWRNPALWERYAGHFSPYLERRIAALRRATRRRKRVLAASAGAVTGNPV